VVMRVEPEEWIGVDLDGTVAIYTSWKRWDSIGEPIPKMVARIKAWLAEGIKVKIFTARVGFESDVCKISGETFTKEAMTAAIQRWTLRHIGKKLEVTATKDFAMRELWDDRAVQVVANTGNTISDEYEAELSALKGKP
jgi:hypothetical protein